MKQRNKETNKETTRSFSITFRTYNIINRSWIIVLDKNALISTSFALNLFSLIYFLPLRSPGGPVRVEGVLPRERVH